MRAGDLLLGVLLAASLCGNGLLLASRHRSGPAASSDRTEVMADRRPLAVRRAPLRPSATLLDCQRRITELSAQSTALTELRHRHLPPAERFKELPPNRPLSSSVTAELERQLAAGGALPCEVECRGDLCRLGFADAPRPGPWFEQFVGVPWVAESFATVETLEDAVFLRWRQPGVVRGDELLKEVTSNFQGSGAVEACRSKFPAEGALEARLSLMPGDEAEDADSPPGLTARIGGALAGTPLGDCVEAELRRSLAAVVLPPRFEAGLLLVRL